MERNAAIFERSVCDPVCFHADHSSAPSPIRTPATRSFTPPPSHRSLATIGCRRRVLIEVSCAVATLRSRCPSRLVDCRSRIFDIQLALDFQYIFEVDVRRERARRRRARSVQRDGAHATTARRLRRPRRECDHESSEEYEFVEYCACMNFKARGDLVQLECDREAERRKERRRRIAWADCVSTRVL
jgi:hypothetical protein